MCERSFTGVNDRSHFSTKINQIDMEDLDKFVKYMDRI
jgi:hypothetical protein